MAINQPSGQIRLTNVSIVKMKRGGKRFEIACYKNKVMEWRNKIETDLDEVLQIHSVFTNVSKGLVAGKQDLKKAFGTDNQDEIILEILKKGDLQVGEKERNYQLSSMFRDIVSHIASMCMNPNTKLPYPSTIIEKALTDSGFSVSTSKNAKSQALEAIKMLQQKNVLPIERARMRVSIVTSVKEGKALRDRLKAMADEVEEENIDDEYELVVVVQPGAYKTIEELIRNETKGRGMVQVLH
ncbi:SBDS family ribosome maturation protein Sdo1 [Schizosaccharomyces japonicus yFS275]|uniref:Ribosome maturation protein SDO1 n=1 Tax=Schizosaccharomyces japonicus (strain yFS275 / FY16936) TaxID=402676 RepID=B6K6Z0_SCHJY|nr:SBDS family ribosome maturation protein Sdo1 [Schizosaccharomyces japonicus yFS275]EEB09294.1 SBDS family ribosome maturation protein Sdo1 [Schizosaccharomyces japonicus yFS275]